MTARVVIVGRPNVGKSSLLNRLAGRRVSIVDPTSGVTRDRVETDVDLHGRIVKMVDTGGYGVDGFEGTRNLTAEIERQIASAIHSADVVLFVVEAQSGIVPLDHEVARLLRTTAGHTHTPILVVVNKADGPSYDANAMESHQLGFGEPILVSAENRRGVGDLIERIVEILPDESEARPEPDDAPLLAIVGKRNAGKSTLTNALVGQERVIVSDVAGTTRDAVDVPFEMSGHKFVAIDTAGLRKRKSVQNDVEYYSHHRALRSVRRADVVLLLIDATLPMSQVDAKIANEITKHFKPVIFVVNKWDLVDAEHTQDEYVEYLDKEFPSLNFSPVAFVSAAKGEGIRELVGMALNLHRQAGDRVSTGILNRIVNDLMATQQPKSKLGKMAKIYYVSQIDVRPPTVALFVNDPKLFDQNYQRFLIGRLRDLLPYSEVPIRLLVRARRSAPPEAFPEDKGGKSPVEIDHAD